MRRLIAVSLLSTVVLVGSAYGVTRRTHSSGSVTKGLVVGLNMAKFTGGDATLAGISPGFRTGFVVGGFVNFNLSRTAGIEIEGLYTMKGSTYSAFGSKGTFKFDYVEIPALLAFKFPGASSVTPHFAFGPSLAIKTSAKYSEQGITVESSELGFPVKSTDFGLVFVGGVGIKSGTGEFLVDVRYDMGLTKWYDYTITPDLKNSSLTFMFGFAF